MFIERNHCPVCHGRDLAELYRANYTDGPIPGFLDTYYRLSERGLTQGWQARFAGARYILQGCGTCRAVSQKLAPDEEFAREIYDNWISGDTAYSPEKGQRSYSPQPFKEHAHAIQEALFLTAFLLRHGARAYPRDLKVLDFGAGWGDFAKAMRACGCEVHTFDLSPTRIEQHRRDGFTVVGPEDIPGQGYAYINTEQVLEHVPEPRETVETLISGLGAKGVLKISVPYARSAETGPVAIDWSTGKYNNASWMPFHPLEHLTYFRRPSLHTMMTQFGMGEVAPSAREYLHYSFAWGGPRNIARNIARALPRRWFRNYFFFSKPS